MSGIDPANYAAVMQAGQSLVPNLHEQILQRRQMDVVEQQANTQTAQETRLRAGFDAEQQEEQAYQRDVQFWLQNPTATGLQGVMSRYPRRHEALRKSWEVQDEEKRTIDFRAAGELFSAGANGRWDLVERDLGARVAADRAAGDLDKSDDALLDMVRSGDEGQRRRALGMMGYNFAVMGGADKVSSILNSLRPVTGPSDAEAYAGSLGLKPGTEEYQRAVQDYVLRSSGPTAHEFDVELEGERQENRVGLEGVRQRGRQQLEGVRQGNRVSLEGVRQGNRVNLEGVRQGGRERMEGTRENNRRTRPPGALIERLRQKVAAGEQLTAGEQRVWDSYGRSNGRGRGRAGGNSARAMLNGRAIVVRGNRWVYEDSGQPAQ